MFKKIRFLPAVAGGVWGVLVLCNAAFAGGPGGPINATEATQLINKGELVKQVNEAVRQTQQQIQMYANMVTNTIGLPVGELKELKKLAMNAYNLYNSAQSIGYGMLSQSESWARNWQSWFPDATQKEKETIAECVERDEKCAESLEALTGQVAKDLEVDLKAIDSEREYADMINNKLETAEGQVQVCQALGHGLYGLSGQLTHMEKLALNQNQIMAAAVARRLEHEQTEEFIKKKLEGTEPVFTGGYSFRTVKLKRK